ncbi:hypothetical protein [Tistrella mobilis]|uniref:hypothetical protein n=1 Tax=Tistrella mobilis TaxID=171437 RepID=UPI0003140F71|nr:hypothetical protein [Tistrella mobilis]
MSALLSKPKGPDPELVAAQKRQAEAAERQSASLKAEEDARRRSITSRSKGRALLLSNDERGVTTTTGG